MSWKLRIDDRSTIAALATAPAPKPAFRSICWIEKIADRCAGATSVARSAFLAGPPRPPRERPATSPCLAGRARSRRRDGRGPGLDADDRARVAVHPIVLRLAEPRPCEPGGDLRERVRVPRRREHLNDAEHELV